MFHKVTPRLPGSSHFWRGKWGTMQFCPPQENAGPTAGTPTGTLVLTSANTVIARFIVIPGSNNAGGISIQGDGAVYNVSDFQLWQDTAANGYTAHINNIGGEIELLVDGQIRLALSSTVTAIYAGATPTAVFEATGNITSPVLRGYGPTAGGFVDMTPDTGSFTFTATGMTTSPTGTGIWARIGNLVLLLLPTITGTSNANTFTYTGLPAAIQPVRTIVCPLVEDYVENGGAVVNTAAAVLQSGSGTVRFDLGGSSTGWGTTLVKGLETAMMISYLLN